MDCTLVDLYCGLYNGEASCLLREIDTESESDMLVDTDSVIDSDTDEESDTGPDTGPDPIERIDTSNCNENICLEYPEDCIADFEDGTLNGVDEDNFGFTAYGDEYGDMFPFMDWDYTGPAAVMADEGCTPFAMCMTSTDEFIAWGAGVGLIWGIDDSEPAGVVRKDISRYRGIGFWALRRSGVNAVSVLFPTPYSVPGFGYCDGDDNAGCYNDYAGHVIVDSKNVWEYKEVLFEDLMVNLTWGYQPPEGTPFPAEESLGLRFSIGENLPFDFCIDEIRFIE